MLIILVKSIAKHVLLILSVSHLRLSKPARSSPAMVFSIKSSFKANLDTDIRWLEPGSVLGIAGPN